VQRGRDSGLRHDPATGDSYTGFGKLYFDAAKQRLAEPTVYVDANGNADGIGVSTWTRGDGAFTPHFITHTSLVGFFPVLASTQPTRSTQPGRRMHVRRVRRAAATARRHRRPTR